MNDEELVRFRDLDGDSFWLLVGKHEVECYVAAGPTPLVGLFDPPPLPPILVYREIRMGFPCKRTNKFLRWRYFVFNRIKR